MEKTIVFDNNESCSNNGMMGLIASLCQNRGLDPNMVMAMMGRNGNGFGDGNGAWIWVIFLFFLMGWGGNGWGGFGGRNGQGEGNFLAGQLANDTGRELLQQAIAGNAQAISQLASTLNCDINAVQGSLNQLQQAICNVGNQVGMGQKDIVFAVQNGNQSILSKLCDCCCTTQRQIADFRGDIALQMCQQTGTLSNGQRDLGVAITKGFCDATYATREQTGQILNAITAQNTFIADKFCALEMREMQRENQNLRDQVSQYRDSALAQNTANNVVQRVNPTPIPAYWVPNVNGCGCNNYGYPFNGNNGCGCNSGCGC